MRCTLSYFCSIRKRYGICCFTCGIRDTCIDACHNNPERCMVSRESTAKELAFDYGAQFIRTKSEAMKIMESGEPTGLFYLSNTFGSYAIDNRTGVPVMSRKFDTSSEAVLWLANRVEADRKRSGE